MQPSWQKQLKEWFVFRLYFSTLGAIQSTWIIQNWGWLPLHCIALYQRISTKHVSEFLGWELVRMMPLFVKDDLIEPSDDWPNLKKECPNPPKHEDGGRGRQNKIFLRNFLNKSQDGSAWFCRNFPAWLSKKIAEFSPKFEELSRRRRRILKLKYLKGLNGSYFAFTSTYLCPSSFLILFAFNLIWTQNNLLSERVEN